MTDYSRNGLDSLLIGNTYPGRGIMLGVSPSGRYGIALYFIMGRSINSRNRLFVQEPDGIRTEAFDPALVTDPSLIIYHPVREAGNRLIVTNGDQTETILAALMSGQGFFEALETRTFEPDAPSYTPRISGLVNEDGSCLLSILKPADADGSGCQREGFSCPPISGLGHYIHTYAGDGSPLPPFTGEPERIATEEDMDSFAEKIWESMNPDNRISLYIRYTDLEDQSCRETIFNRNIQEEAS